MNKVLTSNEALKTWLRQVARPLVFTNGCFDILHRGHVSYLQDARALGAALIVGVNSDDSVRSLGKDDDRPFNSLEDRSAVLAALECVDAVMPFDAPTPLELIQQVSPDHLVKGGDWTVDQIVGADWVREQGGKVHSIAFQFDRSTTQLVERIRQTPSERT